MAWVAFDRTIRSFEHSRVKAPLAEWRSTRDRIHRDVCRHGFNSRIASFVRTYGSKEVDASLLLLPLVGFLPPLDRRIVGTVEMIEKMLMRDGLVIRYRNVADSSYLGQGEGAFLPCSFWLADYYVLAGRRDAAEQLLKRLLALRNDVGLLSEVYDLERKQLVGNFPQALSHVAMVNTIINLYSQRGPVRQRSDHSRRG